MVVVVVVAMSCFSNHMRTYADEDQTVQDYWQTVGRGERAN